MIGRYYKTAEICPLGAFIKVLVSNDVRGLKVYGYVRRQALVDAWEQIFDQYLQISNSQQYALLLRRLKDIAIMRNKTVLALQLVQVLELKYNEKIVQTLRLLGYRQKFDVSSLESYAKDIQRAKKQVKSDLLNLEEMEEKAKNRSKGEVKEADFDQILTELSRFQGYRLDKNKVTVSEYIHILNNYRAVNTKRDGKQRKD